MLREDHTLFTYLHLAPDAPQTEDLVNSGACCIAYETVTDRKGGLPLLAPMSEVAGRLSIQAGAWCLEKAHNGRGVLLGGVPGVEPAKVVIIGGGTVGFNAAQMAVGLGARVVVMDRDADVMKFLDATFESRIAIPAKVPMNVESIPVQSSRSTTNGISVRSTLSGWGEMPRAEPSTVSRFSDDLTNGFSRVASDIFLRGRAMRPGPPLSAVLALATVFAARTAASAETAN